MGRGTKMQKKNKHSQDDELKNDCETTAPSNVTVTEKSKQNHETKPSTQSDVTETEKLNQNHETKHRTQSEVIVTEKSNQNHETKPSAQSGVTETENLNQNHETKPSTQSEVTVTEKSKQNHETNPSAQSNVTEMEKLNQNHETKHSIQSEVTVTEKLNQNQEIRPSAQPEVTATEKLNQNHERKPSALSEVTAMEKLNQDHKTKSSAQSEVTAIETLNQNHEIKPSAQSEVSYTDWQIDEKIKNIRKNLRELQARKAQLQQVNHDICTHSTDFLLFHILLNQEKEKDIKRLYDAEAQLQKANSDIKDKEEEINNLTARLHDVEAQLQQANTDIIEKEEDVKKIYEENKYLTGKLNDAEANLLNITELKVNLEKEIIDLTVQNKSLREKVDRDNELLSRILEYVAENTNEKEKTHPLSCPGSQTITKIASILIVLRNKLECLEAEKKDLKDKLLNLKENDLFCQINNSVMNIDTTIQNQESINEMFTANDESFNNAVEELRLFLPNKTEQYDLVIKELKLIFETRITSILDKIRDLRTSSIFESRLKNTTIHAEDIDELTQKYNGLTLNINENVEQLRGDVPSTSTEPKNKKKSTREEPTGNGSVKRRIFKEFSVDSAETGHLRHKGANSKPMLDYDIEGHRMFNYAKMENDVLLASSTEEISKTNPISVTPIQNLSTFEKPTITDKKLIQMQIVVSATCDGDIPVETTARVQRMEEELRDAKARENKLREQLNEYKNPALVDKTKIVRKKRQVQHDQRRPYQP